MPESLYRSVPQILQLLKSVFRTFLVVTEPLNSTTPPSPRKENPRLLPSRKYLKNHPKSITILWKKPEKIYPRVQKKRKNRPRRTHTSVTEVKTPDENDQSEDTKCCQISPDSSILQISSSFHSTCVMQGPKTTKLPNIPTLSKCAYYELNWLLSAKKNCPQKRTLLS